MKRWSKKGGEFGGYIENKKVDMFLGEVCDVCKRHGLSISHEDSHGGFEVTDYDEFFSGWLMRADDNSSDE